MKEQLEPHLKYNTNKRRSQREANRVLRLARRAKTNFEELAREYSDGPTKNRGGDLGFFREGEMAQEFFNFVNKNRVGKLVLLKLNLVFIYQSNR